VRTVPLLSAIVDCHSMHTTPIDVVHSVSRAVDKQIRSGTFLSCAGYAHISRCEIPLMRDVAAAEQRVARIRPDIALTSRDAAGDVHHTRMNETATLSPLVKIGTAEPPLIVLLRETLNPAIVVGTFVVCVWMYGQRWSAEYMTAAALAVALSGSLLPKPTFGELDIRARFSQLARQLCMQWMWTAAGLLLVALLTRTTWIFSQKAFITWFVATPFTLTFGNFLARQGVMRFMSRKLLARTHVVIGANSVGFEIARRLRANTHLGRFVGFFDDRDALRLPGLGENPLIGKLEDVVEYVRTNRISVTHVALPVMSSPRMQRVLNELCDTTTSVYFIPDIMSCDVLQGRMMEMGGFPVVALRESPFCGTDGLTKRASDFVLASLIFVFALPVMIAIALFIRFTSPGPVLFKQRRYGLDGEEITIYKFRTMTVAEDGADLVQARRNDPRVTGIGRLLRRMSLDELPQLFNVLNGSMSLVGPRPHAIAHNEKYRAEIPGYMMRHKVRPGMTGWAQVNGLRGETDTLDKMRERIRFDLEYLRNWSLWLDITILFRTAIRVWKDRNAY